MQYFKIKSAFLTLCVLLFSGCSRAESRSAEELKLHIQAFFDRCIPFEAIQQAQEKADKVAQEARRQEYEQIIAQRTLYDGLTAGLCYAGYWDLDGDTKEELLLLSLSSGPVTDATTITLETFRNSAGHTGRSMMVAYTIGLQDLTLSLSQKDGQLYLGCYTWSGLDSDPRENRFYSLNGGQPVLEEHFFMNQLWSGGHNGEPYYISCSVTDPSQRGVEWTQAQYRSALEQYAQIEPILSFVQSSGRSFTCSRGILPKAEPSANVQRRLAFLSILDETPSLESAWLIDLNGDDAEDLLTLFGQTPPYQSYPNYYFKAYLWDGTAVQTVDLSRTLDEEIDSYLETWYADHKLYRKTDTGTVYVCYDGETAGGWGGTLLMNPTNPSDFEFFGHPYLPSDFSPGLYSAEEIEFYEAQYAAEKAAYEAGIGRYTPIDSTAEQVSSIRQQLLNPDEL